MATSKGFSLLEMAIVIIVMGLLLGGTLTPLSTHFDQQRRQLTQQRLQEIQEALLGYAVLHKRLPCPAECGKFGALKSDNTTVCSDDEVGKESPTWCSTQHYLPWVTLGVGRYDSWGNPFWYEVETAYTKIAKSNIVGNLRIRDTRDIYLTNKSDDSRVVAIILSGGKQSDLDLPNNKKLTAGKIYVEDVRDLREDYDDILSWLSKNTLASRLVSAKQWP